MSMEIRKWLAFYLGCRTNLGELIGIKENLVMTKSENGNIVEFDTEDDAFPVKLLLRKINSLSPEQSVELISKGFSIGRPTGYSFSPAAFLFLITLHVDLFGLIEKGLAVDLNNQSPG